MAGESPAVASLAWGKVEVEGEGRFKDVKLFPGGAREWDWRETGTRHSPGIQVADVEELLEHGAEVVILSRGVWKRLRVPAATLDHLQSLGVEAHALQSEEAVALYNELRRARPVGCLLHSTC